MNAYLVHDAVRDRRTPAPSWRDSGTNLGTALGPGPPLTRTRQRSRITEGVCSYRTYGPWEHKAWGDESWENQLAGWGWGVWCGRAPLGLVGKRDLAMLLGPIFGTRKGGSWERV